MKMIIAFLIIFFAAMYMYIQWHNYAYATITETTVLRDETDRQLAEVSADAIFKQFNLFEKYVERGAIFRYSTISDVSFNKVILAEFEHENPWLENDLDRTTRIEIFRNEVFAPFKEKKDSAFKHSSVYLPIARELSRLGERPTSIRRLYVYSDLMENTPELSFYSEETFTLLKNHPDIILKKFEEWLPLPSLEGIEVHLIYQPADITADKNFRVVSEFYGKMLEAKGAKVIIQANLQN
jgi:hypothetical protein